MIVLLDIHSESTSEGFYSAVDCLVNFARSTFSCLLRESPENGFHPHLLEKFYHIGALLKCLLTRGGIIAATVVSG